jgi:hypothetical protein
MNTLNPLKITHIGWILWLIALIGLQKDKAVAQITPTVDFSLIEPISQPSFHTELMQATAWIKITDNKIFLVGKAPVKRFSGNWLSYANCQRE